VVKIDLNRPMEQIRAELTKHPVTTQLALTGSLVVARDIAHAKIKERLDRGEPMPQYLKDHPVYYAGPAKTPPGMPSGSFGPTTAGRMDSYVDCSSPRRLAGHDRQGQPQPEGHRGVQEVRRFYLGSIGGPAAIWPRTTSRRSTSWSTRAGMEAVYRIDVVDFPAFILVDDKGNDFYQKFC